MIYVWTGGLARVQNGGAAALMAVEFMEAIGEGVFDVDDVVKLTWFLSLPS